MLGRFIHKGKGESSLWLPWSSPQKQHMTDSNHPNYGEHHMTAVKSTPYVVLTPSAPQGLVHRILIK